MKNSSWSGMLLVCGAMLFGPALAAGDHEEIRDRVSFQVDVGTDVENDLLVAVLSITAEDKAPDNLADTINQTMSWALQQLKGSENIKSRSGSYQTFPVYDDRKIVRWRGRQDLYLESQAVEELSRMLGLLQSRLQIQSLQFSVSPEALRQVEERLIEQVIAAWRKRAESIARAFGPGRYELLDVAIHSGATGPVVPVRAEMMSMKSRADVSAPALESGTSRVTVQASGSVRLVRD